MQVLKALTLYGSRYESGSPLPDAAWNQCDKRLRQVLERGRFVTHTPVARPDMAPRPLRTPRNADGPTSKRGRPRKAV